MKKVLTIALVGLMLVPGLFAADVNDLSAQFVTSYASTNAIGRAYQVDAIWFSPADSTAQSITIGVTYDGVAYDQKALSLAGDSAWTADVLIVVPADGVLTFVSDQAVTNDVYIRRAEVGSGTPVIVSGSLSALSVDESELAAGSVSSNKLASGAVTRVKIAADAVDGTKLADDAVDSEHIAAGAVDLEHMSANSVDSDQYVDGSIDTVHLGNDQVTRAKLSSINITNNGDVADTTVFAPDYIGQLLVELTNSDGTNNVWLAVGLTTNDWESLK